MALATVPPVTDPRELALLKAVGLDRVSPEQRELALHIAARYDLDLMLRHIVMIEGRPYITRDALLHIAHRSEVLDGIEATEPVLVDGFWRASCSVYRKDMSRPFTYGGRYPEKGMNAKFAPEMAIKVAESMALRRAFDVAAPTQDERWDVPEAAALPIEAPARPSLAERVAAKAAEVEVSPTKADMDAVQDYLDDVADEIAPRPVPLADGQEGLPGAPMTVAASAAVKLETRGLTIQQLADLARARDVGKMKFAVALEAVPADVGRRIEAMTDAERYELGVRLGLV